MRTPSSQQDPLIGTIIGGRYEVVRLIGQGAFGSVYEVRSTRLARSFALKTLSSEKAGDAHTLERFRREADVIASLKHPNIVEVIDWETLEDGSPAMIMEYLRGEDLAQRIEAGPLVWPLLARIADEMLAAVSVAHAHGVVHRDLKPENVFLAKDDAGNEHVKLLDFGVSKIRDAKGRATTEDTVLGTPAYMPPEQADGRPADVGTHSDVWSAGAILFEMATGQVPFSAPSVPSILYKICHGKPASLLEHRPDAPPAFVELVAETFTKDTSGRIADIAVLRARLRESLKDLPGVRFADPLPPVVAKAPTDEKATIDAKAATPDAKAPPTDAKVPTLAATTNAGSVTSPSMVQRRKLAPIAFAMLGIAAIAVVTTVVIATREKPAKSSAAITTPHEAARTSPETAATSREATAAPSEATTTPREASATPPETTTSSAGNVGSSSAPIGAINAGRAPTRETSRAPANTPKQRTEAPAAGSAATTPTVEPPVAPPKKKACAKDDVECLYGDGT